MFRLFAWIVLFVASAFSSLTYSQMIPADPPAVNAQGQPLYLVLLDSAVVDLEPVGDEPPARDTMDPRNAEDVFGWQLPRTRAFVKRFAKENGITAVSMTSHIFPSLSAYLSDEALARVAANPAVTEVHKNHEMTGEVFQSWIDTMSGAEIIPWGKSAVGMNDALSTSNPVYVLDGIAKIGIALPPVYHNDLPSTNLTFALVNGSPTGTGTFHALHVSGIVGAVSNNAMVRGANPGAPVVNVFIGSTTPTSVVNAMNWTLAETENKGIFAVANMSFVDTVNRYFDRLTAGGQPGGGVYTKAVRSMSNRVMVAQSAGNQHQDPCPTSPGTFTFVYPFTNANDGVVVVGGIDSGGNEAVPFFNMPLAANEAGSNYGPCVELYSPASQIWSLFDGSQTDFQRLSGTSMAAPYMAALAARYGGPSTRPIERENYLRAKLVATGSTATGGATIKVPSYVQAPTFTIPLRLAPVSVSPTPTGTGLSSLTDGLFLTGSWSAGAFPPASIIFDLGASKTVKAMRLVPEMSPNPSAMDMTIKIGNTNPPTTVVATVTGSTELSETLLPIIRTLSAVGRYVKVEVTSGPSWVAFREIEIYGN